MPAPWSRAVRFFWAAHAGRRDGRLGVPYDHHATGSGHPDGNRWTKFIGTVAADSACRRARVMKAFIHDTRQEEGALLVTAGRVNDLTRGARDLRSPASPAASGSPSGPAAGSSYPLSLADVIAARRESALGGRRQALDAELAAARQALAERLSVYEAAVRQMRTNMNEVAWWANHLVAHYHQALDRSYLAGKKREGDAGARLPHWEPAKIEPDESEERLVMSGDLLSLLPPKVREVVEEALGHIGTPAGEGGAA
ncbi:hypothetical protein AB0O34_01310 [Sphaerisporangium sp. NPDC088356]|uniref:hypothetical protein n=1 Tax=Sphaerisporangium sp. NPDC088356 TaxID=3154871 RepID=UPI003436746A